MLDPSEKSIDRPVNSLAYNITLPIYLVFEIAINTKNVNLRFGFRLCAVIFLCSEVELRLFKVLLRQIVRTVDMDWGFV